MYHMRTLCRKFLSEEVQEDMCKDIDKMHFVINMDNGRTLRFYDDKKVKDTNMVLGGMGMIMVVKVSRGVHGKISTPFMIFQNSFNSHPIQNLPNNVSNVCYCTTRKGVMTRDVRTQYYMDGLVSFIDTRDHTKFQFFDNALGHKILPATTTSLQ